MFPADRRLFFGAADGVARSHVQAGRWFAGAGDRLQDANRPGRFEFGFKLFSRLARHLLAQREGPAGKQRLHRAGVFFQNGRERLPDLPRVFTRNDFALENNIIIGSHAASCLADPEFCYTRG